MNDDTKPFCLIWNYIGSGIVADTSKLMWRIDGWNAKAIFCAILHPSTDDKLYDMVLVYLLNPGSIQVYYGYKFAIYKHIFCR